VRFVYGSGDGLLALDAVLTRAGVGRRCGEDTC
jgi:hypothetical protein